MGLIRITHKNLPDGVLIDSREFNPDIHTPFEARNAELAGAGVGGASLEVAQILDGPVAQVEAALSHVDEVPLLIAIRDAETAGKNRKGVLAAIEARNAELAGAGGE